MAEVSARRVLFLAVLLALCFVQKGNSTKEWVKEEFPNPTKDLRSCGRRGKASWICDPDNVLSYETTNKVEELLYSVGKNTVSGCSSDAKAGFQIGVAVFKKMRDLPGESVEKTAEKFTKHLHDSWGVGHADCDDGAMLLLSILDRQVYVSTGKKAMELLSNDKIDIIIEEMKPYLQGKDYDKSVELAVVRMGEVFSGKVLKRPFNYGALIAFAIGVVMVGVWLYLPDQERAKWTRMLKRFFSRDSSGSGGGYRGGSSAGGGFGGGNCAGGGGGGGGW